MPAGTAAGHPFDGLAHDYDTAFVHSSIGSALRARVWDVLRESFSPGQRVLDLGCGTGEDAVRLARSGIAVVAVDVSERMVEATRTKAAEAGVGHLVAVHRLAIEDLATGLGTEIGDLDGVVSDFGALNCVGDLEALATELPRRLRPGARAVFCVMGPVVPWEWAWYLVRGRPRRAFRRLRREGSEWRGLTVRYPSIGTLRETFIDGFRWLGVSALGAVVPPSYAEAWAVRHPRVLGALDRCEKVVARRWPVPWLADHYLAELERR